MKKLLFSAIVLALTTSAFATAYYCDPASKDETAYAEDWKSAVSVAGLQKTISAIPDGDTIFIKGGTIRLTAQSAYWLINHGITIIGGFDPAAKGVVTELPTYPSATPTIISGDINNNGKPDAGDAATLIRIDLSESMKSKATIQGLNFINTYYSDPTESTKDIDSYLNMCSAIRVICGTAFIKNCEMYNHIMPANRGSQCITSVGANLHIIDCDLHHCQSLSRGALVRGREYFIKGVESNPIAPSIVIERCALHHASNQGGSDMNTDGTYGGAVHMSAGELFAINSTFICDTTYSNGGAIRSVTGVTTISCTFAENYSTRINNTSISNPYSYGSSFGLESDCPFRVMNTFVVHDADNGTKKHTPFYSDKNTEDMPNVCISGGYNVLGTMYYAIGESPSTVITDQSDVWLPTDLTSKSTSVNKFSDFFGSVADLKDNGGCSKSILPKSMQDGASVAELQEFADEYCPEWTKVDASLDQRGYKRDANITCVGAAAIDAEPITPIDNVEAVSNHANSTKYNVLGQPVEDSYKGVIIQYGRKYINL